MYMVIHGAYAPPVPAAQPTTQPPQSPQPAYPPIPASLASRTDAILAVLSNAQIGLLFAAAFCQVVPPSDVYHARARDVQDLTFLERAQLIIPQRGGYVLTPVLGHAVLEAVERREVQRALAVGMR